MHVVINVPINGMPLLLILGARWGKGGDLPHFLLQRTYPLGHNSMSTPLPILDSCNYTIVPPLERIFKTNAPSPLAVTLEQLEVQCNVCKLP